MRWPRGFRTASRHLLALVAVLAFGLSAGTPTLMHGCAHAQSAADAHTPSHHHSGAPEHERPAPGDECRCVGQSCCTALAALPASVPVACAVATRRYPGPRVVPGAPRTDLPHLLPFANGPPVPLLS